MKLWKRVVIGSTFGAATVGWLAACIVIGIENTPMPVHPVDVRFATFNISFDRSNEGDLDKELSKSVTALPQQVKNIVEIIRINRPDVILLNEFNWDADNVGISKFKEILNSKELSFSKSKAKPIDYPYFFTAESNSGDPSGIDLNMDGKKGAAKGTMDYANDAYGFGQFPGKYAMALLSKYPIDTKKVRTFRKFLWKDMPGALLPTKVATMTEGGKQVSRQVSYYTEEVLNVFRLSSKDHWDIPLKINNEIIHVLASHPTPPTFDGPEDRNGKRNHDENRFWRDYIDPNLSREEKIQGKEKTYIVDDKGNKGDLEKDAKFVIMGDLNATPNKGKSILTSVGQLLNSPYVNDVKPKIDKKWVKKGDDDTVTADFGKSEGTRNVVRVDYVLPSKNLEVVKNGARVFWPKSDDPIYGHLKTGKDTTSDHHLVYLTVKV